ncbi:LysM peptidoglycan-binding domain-containing protein [Acinetobacter sp. A3.8]|uniref:LysM peptidoglycan-binding domain-containing protein n=1 Tax=Acinetobacter sedimenti TaxID=2919922 RepID=A0A9X1WXP7_9GAMM|nr:LysM peptidoglycan-binding domain-containing protein [Acinetobacter sedimenti]MCJ8147044.1 LysM peptidoglycan-binding domain-containing protein [Acinetobacter sedimenti]
MLNATPMIWSTTISRSFRLSIIATAIASLGALTACSSTPQKASVSKTTTNVADDELLDTDSFDSLENLLYATDMRAVEGDRLLILRHGDVWKRMTVGFKMNLNLYNPRIEAQRGWFITRQPYLDRLSARASRYIYYTVKEAERRGIPTELALLPVIESSYDPAATSSAAAAGMWQFIPSTGKIYGLRQTDLYDGRRDVVESTRAAYEYLSSLYNQFGSWELALAAYNGGPGRVQQAINRNKAAGLATDFWSLKLPTETMNYVPRFLAVAQIIKNPHQYGVSLPPIANRPHFREVTIPGAIDLNELSSISGVSRGELYALNPGHRGNYTDPFAPNRILIPNEVSASVDTKIAKMKTVSGSGGLWAGGSAPLPTLKSANTPSLQSSVLVTRSPSELPNSSAIAKQQTSTQKATTATTQATTNNSAIKITTSSSATAQNTTVATAPKFEKQSTPKGSNALASFASDAYVPSAPRLPVSITPSTAVKQINLEPPISEVEKQAIVAEQAEQTAKTTAQTAMQVEKIAEQQPSEAVKQQTEVEKQKVIAELEKIAPKGTEIVDPLDGKIRLTAIQSSQSIAEQTGQDVEINYAIPKAVAEAELAAKSKDAELNRAKPIVETKNEVVVVAPKGKREIYSVKSGDTLAIIATRFGVNWRDIAEWNQISAERPLYVGTKLYLYDVKPPVEKVEQAKAPERYTVRAGDSLTNLANQYQLNLRDVAAWNDLTPTSYLRIGQRITLVEPKDFKAKNQQDNSRKDSAQKGDTQKENSKNAEIKTVEYRVKRGEYLKQIADRYKMSTTELAALNPDLNASSGLLVGQRIRVPANQKVEQSTSNTSQSETAKDAQNQTNSSAQTTSYTVVAGDYLSNVATKHKISLAELAKLNNLKTNSQIYVGQKLQVPVIEEAVKPAPTSSKRPSTYQVQSGDTLIAVADKFDLYVKDLAQMNDIATNAMLRRGQVLKLQADADASNSASDTTHKDVKNAKTNEVQAESESTANFKGATESYTVRSGESLTAISSRYGITNAELAGLNNISSRASLRVGQKLKVPKLTQSYQVKRGDSLIALARKYGVTTEELAEMNDLKANAQLQLGQSLTVPNN